VILDHIQPRKPNPSSSVPPSLLALLAPAGIAVAGVALWFLSAPAGLKGSIEGVEATAASVGRAAAEAGDLKSFPAGSVCSGELGDGVRSQMKMALANTGLQVSAFDISEAGQLPGAVLRAYSFSLKGKGSYEDALAVLDVLNRSRPKLFVDSFALRNRVDAVELDIDGRLFCR